MHIFKKCDALKKKTELFSRNSVVMEPVLGQILFQNNLAKNFTIREHETYL